MAAPPQLRAFHGRRILVAEDEYMLANLLRLELEWQGAVVVGPVASLKAAMELVLRGDPLDGAILDIHLADGMAYPLADALWARSVPLVFTTGGDPANCPEAYRAVPRCEKPVEMGRLAKALFG